MLYVNGWICWNDICISYISLTDALLNKNQDLLVVLRKVTILHESSTLDKKHIPLILPNWKPIKNLETFWSSPQWLMAKGVSSSFVETPKTVYACSKGDREKSYFSLFLALDNTA